MSDGVVGGKETSVRIVSSTNFIRVFSMCPLLYEMRQNLIFASNQAIIVLFDNLPQ